MAETITCTSCARQASAAQPVQLWSVGIHNGRREYCCDRCARESIRLIEARLDA
jgi:hypothetical protein